MSSLPSEVLEDVLKPLDRWSLDAAQLTNRRFMQVIMEHTSDVCLRPIVAATFEVPYKAYDAHLHIRIDSRPEREIRKRNKDAAHLFSEFLQALRSSRVRFLTLSCDSSKGFVFTSAMATLVLETPVIAHHLRFYRGSYAELTPTQFRDIVLRFSPTSVELTKCDLLPSQVSDEFLRALFKNGVLRTRINADLLEDNERGAFHVTDDAVLDFFVDQPDQEEEEDRELSLSNGAGFTKDLFKRLVEASAASTRERRLYIRVRLVRFEDGDLSDFEQHLSYRDRGRWSEARIYDFPGELPAPNEPSEEVPHEMHLQIVLNPHKGIFTLQRARFQSSIGWYYSDDHFGW